MVIYLFLYLGWFFIIEQRDVEHFTVIHMAIDDYIPFLEIFVIPYFCWFGYVALSVLYFIFFDKEEYTKLFTTLVTGMTLFLIISTIWPNMHELRPETFARDNVLTRMIGGLYTTDTCTNLVPSIHVYNSIMVAIAIFRSEKLRKYTWLQIASLILSALIVLSTVFIKQHSFFDVITGVALAGVMYVVVYKWKLNYFTLFKKKS